MTEAFITPRMLRWARERSFDNIADAANKLNVRAEKLEAWEQERARPTFRQAQELAKKLNIPFGYLYLSEPPDEALPLPDLRTRPGSPPRKPSPDFLEVIYDALRKQDWYREYLTNEGADNLPFVGRFAITAPAIAVAEDIRRTLGLTESFRRSAGSRDNFFNQLVRHAENAGMLVMRTGFVGSNTRRLLDPNEFQGFAVSDDIAPLIFVNQQDFKAAQIFTFIHELAHIWTGISGVSGVEYLARAADQANDSERIADAIAAETLVPQSTFEVSWDNFADIDDNLEKLSAHYRVSQFVILRRAYELQNINYENFRSKYEELSERTRNRQKKGGGGSPDAVFSRNSRTITTTLLLSVLEGKVLPKEASALLNIRISKLPALAKYIGDKGYA